MTPLTFKVKPTVDGGFEIEIKPNPPKEPKITPEGVPVVDVSHASHKEVGTTTATTIDDLCRMAAVEAAKQSTRREETK